MIEGVKQICALAIFCGVAMSLMPEGGVKQVAGIGCALILILGLIGAVKELDMSAYSLELAKYREMGREISERADEARDSLNRRVIEQECETYIVDKATEFGIQELTAKVTARWSMEGVWLPYTVSLQGVWSEAQKERLSGRIEAELGITRASQEWNADGKTQVD